MTRSRRPKTSTRAAANTSSGDRRARKPGGPARKGVVSRVHKGDLDRVTAYLPVELGTKLRMTCALQRIELSEAIADALRDWLTKQE
jgi:hypothetical protein